MKNTTTKRTITTYPDGSLKVIVEDTRTLAEKVNGELTWGEKLAVMYPSKTTEAEITAGWAEFDNHKRIK